MANDFGPRIRIGEGDEVRAHGFDAARLGDVAQQNQYLPRCRSALRGDGRDEGAVVPLHGDGNGIFDGAHGAVPGDGIDCLDERRTAQHRCDVASDDALSQERFRRAIRIENMACVVHDDERIRQAIEERHGGAAAQHRCFLVPRRADANGRCLTNRHQPRRGDAREDEKGNDGGNGVQGAGEREQQEDGRRTSLEPPSAAAMFLTVRLRNPNSCHRVST